MKKITLFLLLVSIASIASAQDILVKNDKTELKVKVLEITETTISYKKFELLDGPTYAIAKAEVFMIIYQNGTKEYMENKQIAVPKTTTPKPNNTIASVMNTTGENAYQTSSSGKVKTNKSSWGAQLSVLSTNANIGGDGGASTAVIRMRAGVYFTIPLNKKFTMRPSINIVGKGSKISYMDNVSAIDEEINTSFIEIPLSLVYTTQENKGLMLGIAPNVSFRVAQSAKGTMID